MTWLDRLAPLKARPGKWACFGPYKNPNTAQTMAYRLRRRDRVRMPEGRFEFRVEGPKIYARYLGPEREEA